ncbi:MAG: SGNH/GDSL hydrolase family protein [Lachnospiraceae bacterium]|nr:SGNH/GDSL hydrolase family protein [Lachnospiraceae bacterium]
MKIKNIIRITCSAAVILIGLFLLQRLLIPKYVSEVVEGRLIEEYYNDEKDHDVIFIGDCEVYENFSPIVLWKEYGINSYIRGSAQQLIWQSYYLLEDTLRYEKPDVVIFNVLAMQYDKPQKEAYNRMTLEGMRWSSSKVKAINASMTENEKFLDYVFPILRYHSRWKELGSEDVSYMFRDKTVSHNGYYMRVDVRPAENVPEGKILADYRFGENAYDYLDKITSLCKENDIQLVLIKAPSLYPFWYDEWEEQMEEYARENDLLYINFLELTDETGLDFTKDTYDGGLHMNLSGAEKITKYLGEILEEEYDLPDRRGEEELAERWIQKVNAYEEERERQLKNIETGKEINE